MDWIRQIQEAIRYMEEHLLEDIRYEDAARHVCLSAHSLHRAFSLLTGMTASEYIRRRRLSMAAHELQTTGISVINAALKYGYETPESFSKAFYRFHGVTPRQAKIPGTLLRMFNPLSIQITLNGGTVMDYRIVKKNALRFAALVRTFPCEITNDETDHSISDFWDECRASGQLETLHALISPGKGDLYGLCSPEADDEGRFRYGIGVLIDGHSPLPDFAALTLAGCTIWETDPAEYAVFRCEGKDSSCITHVWNRFYREFLPQTGYRQTELTDYEIYPEESVPGMFCELWIPVAR